MHLIKIILCALGRGLDRVEKFMNLKVYNPEDQGSQSLVEGMQKRHGILQMVTANHITFFRIVLTINIIQMSVIGICFGIMSSKSLLGYLLLLNIAAYVTDWLDGPWARTETKEQIGTTDSKTKDLGSLLDNTSDKLLCLADVFLVICLWKIFHLSNYILLLAICILLIDATLSVFRRIASKHELHLKANIFGKLKIWGEAFGFSSVIGAQVIPFVGIAIAYLSYIALTWALFFGMLSFIQHCRKNSEALLSAIRA